MRLCVALQAAGLLFLAACADWREVTSPDRPNAQAFSFVNGPAELPNVVRYDRTYGVAWTDPETGLYLALNWRCGAEMVSIEFQDVGQLQGAIHSISNADVMIRVFQTNPGRFNICTAPPLAQGIGSVRSSYQSPVDDDSWATFTSSINARLTKDDGSSTMLSAKTVILTRGEEVRIPVEFVRLTP